MLKPFSVLLFLGLSAWSFFQLEVARYTEFWRWTETQEKFDHHPITIGVCINWACFYTILLMALICLFVMVFSEPGYIPYDYKYERSKMLPRDAVLHQKLMAALHSTDKQKAEMFENGLFKRGSMIDSNESPSAAIRYGTFNN